MTTTAFGIDFGTTNTVVVKSTAPDEVEALTLGDGEHARPVHPSVIAFETTYEGDRMTLASETGDAAISLAATYPEDFRYVQSFKSHVASGSFAGTTIFGKRFELSEIFASYLKRSGIAGAINKTPGPKKIVVGRPVVFHGDKPDEQLAISRYEAGFRAAGIDDFTLVLEPVGGAFSFFRAARTSVCVLIADFGGGTSDFAVVRFTLAGSRVTADVLAHAGIGIAGDDFDSRIIDNALARHFGSDTHHRINGKWLPVPRSYYSALSRWHQLTQLRTPKRLRELEEIKRTSDSPEKIDKLIHAINRNKGLEISRHVAAAKARLSEHDSAELSIDLGDENRLAETITRSEFEAWISDDVRRIQARVDDVVKLSHLSDRDIEMVFLTGGTSFVPAIHAIFVDRFGQEKVRAGERFSAVAEGLSLIGQGEDVSFWSAA